MREPTSRRWARTAVPFVALAFVAAACNGDDDDQAGETTTSVETTPGPTEPAGTEPAGTEPAGTEPAGTDPAGTEPVGPTEIATDFGVTDDTIRIGLNADLSGDFESLGSQIVDAQRVFWEVVNDNGGIADRQVELVVRDNAYDVPTHAANYEEMAAESDDGVVMFSMSAGSPHTSATAEMLVEDNLLAIPLSWYSGWPDPNYGENVLELGPNYCIEAMNGLTYLAGANPDASTVAILTVPGAYGQDGAAGAKIAAAALGLEVVYPEGEGAVGSGADQTEVITQLLNANPDLVWAAITPTSLRQILGNAYAGGLRARWSGNSPTYDYHLLDSDIATILDDFYTHSTYQGLWNTGDAPGMRALVDAMRAKRPDAPASDVYVVAWEAGLVTKQVLEKAAVNGDMTRAGVVAAAKDPALEIDLQGLAPNQTYGGDPNDYIVRETYMFEVDLAKYTPGATVSDPAASTGHTLLGGPFVSDTARDYDYQGPCFVPET